MNAPVLVPRGLLPTPFDARTAPLNLSRAWQPWAGYATAAHFDTVEAEYFAIRIQATLFDVSAMRKFRIRGPYALRVMNRLVTRDLRKLRLGRVTYALWCDEDGMVIDDGTVFRLGENDFRLCCQKPQYGWLLDVGWGFDITVEDESGTVTGLSLQGPTSFADLEDAGLGAAETLKAFDLAEIDGILISRTDFTGDLGYELWVPPPGRWRSGIACGAPVACMGCGRSAMTRSIWPGSRPGSFWPAAITSRSITRPARPAAAHRSSSAIASWSTSRRTTSTAGAPCCAHAEKGPRYALVGLDVEGGKPAYNALVYHRRKTEIGHVTSAGWSPTCKRNLALAMLKAPYGVTATSDLWVEIYRDKEGKWERTMAAARIAPRPFFRHPRRAATPPERF